MFSKPLQEAKEQELRGKQEYITNCIEHMKDFKGVTIAVKAKDTISIHMAAKQISEMKRR